MISIISLGSRFSGGGIVLLDIIKTLQSHSINVVVREPSKSGVEKFQRIRQVFWFLYWPLSLLAKPAQTVVVAHSLFLLSPFIILLRNHNLFFLFQGEEYKALRWSIISHLIELFIKGNFKRFKCIATNSYLAEVSENMGAHVIGIRKNLGPKRIFYIKPEYFHLRQHVLIFARDGFNKGLDDALTLANLIHGEIAIQFIAPDESTASKIRVSGFDCIVSVDPNEVLRQLQKTIALFIPSHYEGLSLPMLEALATGTPVVTYAEGFPKFYSNINKNVYFVGGRNSDQASQLLIDFSLKKSQDINYIPFIDCSIFSFEDYCDEVACILISSVNSLKE